MVAETWEIPPDSEDLDSKLFQNSVDSGKYPLLVNTNVTTNDRAKYTLSEST